MKIAVLLMLSSVLSQARPAPDPELSQVRTQLEHGQYDEALRRAKERLERGDLAEEDQLELHRMAAVSAFNLKRRDEAERQFTALLRIDPDYSLDPFVVPPPTVAFFDNLRRRLEPSLKEIRDKRRERLQREEEEHARNQAAEAQLDAQRRRIDDLSREVAMRASYRPFWVNLLPFGAGQFQQGRKRLGIALAASEAALAATSLASFFIVDGLVDNRTVPVETEPGRTVDVTVRHVAVENQGKLDAWKTVKLSTGLGFYALYLFGVIEAIGYHGKSVPAAPVGDASTGDAPVRPAPYAFGVPGGGGVGVRSNF